MNFWAKLRTRFRKVPGNRAQTRNLCVVSQRFRVRFRVFGFWYYRTYGTSGTFGTFFRLTRVEEHGTTTNAMGALCAHVYGKWLKGYGGSVFAMQVAWGQWASDPEPLDVKVTEVPCEVEGRPV